MMLEGVAQFRGTCSLNHCRYALLGQQPSSVAFPPRVSLAAAIAFPTGSLIYLCLFLSILLPRSGPVSYPPAGGSIDNPVSEKLLARIDKWGNMRFEPFLDLALLLFILWLGSFLVFHVASALIHLLLLFAIISVVVHFLTRGTRTA